MIRREVALHHLVVNSLIRKPGFTDRRGFVLYVIEDGGELQPLLPLVEYQMEQGRFRSLAWQKEVARATGLFIDFLKANAQHFQSAEDRPQVLAVFAEALVAGTISPEGNDSSGLYWEPKTLNRANALLNSLTAFSDWLVQRYETTAINPWRQASVAEQIAYWRRFEKRRGHALLTHTFDREDAVAKSRLARTVMVLRKGTVGSAAPVKYFPAGRIDELLEVGFAAAGKQRSPHLYERLNIRDAMITVLLHGGGLRESEPFHLYVSDVAVDPTNPKSALVRVFHPEQGRAPDDYIDPLTGKRIEADREEYLRVKWGLEPRSLLVGRFHAGWKDLHLTDLRQKFAQVHWFPSFWGEVFLELFKLYITKVRSRHVPHPFLFVSQKEDVAGAPYTLASYRQAHAKAVKRIGLKVGKDYGTTPHGHRHAYGQLLKEAKVDPMLIQRCMHHKSIDSQQIYTEPTPAVIATTLAAAESNLSPQGECPLLSREDGL